MDRVKFSCIVPLRVRWVEVDMQRVVFNGHYLMYFDTATAEYWRAIGAGRAEVAEFLLRLFVVRATIDYHGSAHYDELIDVGCRVARIGRSSLAFRFAIWRDADVLVDGEIVYVHAAAGERTAAPIPAAIRTALVGYERTPPELAAAGVPR